MLNFNGMHREWVYSANGLPKMILQAKLNEFRGDGTSVGELEEITFKYSGTRVVAVYHVGNSLTQIPASPKVVLLNQDSLKRMVIDDKYFSTKTGEKKWLTNLRAAAFQTHIYKYAFDYDSKGRISRIHYRGECRERTGVYSYKENNLLDNITFNFQEGESRYQVRFNYFYTLSIAKRLSKTQ